MRALAAAAQSMRSGPWQRATAELCVENELLRAHKQADNVAAAAYWCVHRQSVDVNKWFLDYARKGSALPG